MADRISDQRLREIVADEDDYAEARCMAAELLAARARVAELERDVDLTRDDLKFLDDVRKENVQLRVDLRKAMELLRANAEVRMWVFRADADAKAVANWVRERDALLDRHKETP